MALEKEISHSFPLSGLQVCLDKLICVLKLRSRQIWINLVFFFFVLFLPSRVVEVGSLEASLRGKSPSHHTTSCHELASSALMNGFHHNVNILLKLTLFLKESKIIVKVGHEKLHQPVQDW